MLDHKLGVSQSFYLCLGWTLVSPVHFPLLSSSMKLTSKAYFSFATRAECKLSPHQGNDNSQASCSRYCVSGMS